MQNDLADRICGCLLGGAIGDAMGGPFEGQSGPLRYREHSPWAISDDTQLTLATCESIIEQQLVSAEHIAARLLTWFRQRRITGMGASTLKALRDLDAGAHWALAGAKGEMSAGNGAAMRIAPLAFFCDPQDDRDRQTIRDVCRITHHNDEAYVGALAVVAAIRSLDRENAVSTVIQLLPDSRVRDRMAELSKLPKNLPIGEVAARYGTSGYVVESVPLALYAARFSSQMPFCDGMRNVIEAGGDTDTIASMAGQVIGAWIGAASLPGGLVSRLPNLGQIQGIAEKLARTVSSRQY